MVQLLAGLVLTVGPAGPAGPAPVDTLEAIRGQVRSAETGRPLPHVVVEASSDTVRRFAIADARGRYAIDEAPAGRWTLRAAALDHEPLEVEVFVPSSAYVVVDLTLRVRPVDLPPLRTSAYAVPPDTAPATRASRVDGDRMGGGTGEAELRALEAGPGVAELGLARAVAGGAGRDPSDPSSLLFVRGAASDLKLVLLDGAPVYAPFHLAGLMDSFHPGVIESSRLFVGGAPARYDGGLAYVLDLRTRPGSREEPSAAGSADLLSFRQRVEGPVGPATVLIAGRALHRSGADAIVTGRPLPYAYGDAIVRGDLPVGRNGELAATAFWNREAAGLDSVALSGESALWGNTAGSLRYSDRLRGGELELSAGYGRFRTRLPLPVEEGEAATTSIAGESRRLRLLADYARSLDRGWRARAGISYDRRTVDFRVGDGTIPLDGSDVGESAGLYGEAVWSGTDRVELRGGLRSDAFVTAGQLRLAPRARLTWRPDGEAKVYLALGRFHQYVRGAGETETAGLISAGREGPPLQVVGASHLVLGIEDEVREGLRLGIEGYFKRFGRVPGAGDDVRTSGLDLQVDRTAGRLVGRVGYSLAFAWSSRSARTTISARHLLTSSLAARLHRGITLETRLAYGAGLPFSSIPVVEGGASGFGSGAGEDGDSPNSDTPIATSVDPEEDDELPAVVLGTPPGSYLRLDGKLSRSWPARLGGVDVEVVPYVRVLNALDRRDALFFQLDPRRDLDPRPLGVVPVVPVVGLEWKL